MPLIALEHFDTMLTISFNMSWSIHGFSCFPHVAKIQLDGTISRWVNTTAWCILLIHDRYCLGNDITSIIDRHLQMQKAYIDVIWVLAYKVGLVNVSRGIYNSLNLCSSDGWGLVLRMCQRRTREREGERERARTASMESEVNPLRHNITSTNEWAQCPF